MTWMNFFGLLRFEPNSKEIKFYEKSFSSLIFVCGHRPKTKELLELFLLFLFFTIWFISSYKLNIILKSLTEAGFNYPPLAPLAITLGTELQSQRYF